MNIDIMKEKIKKNKFIIEKIYKVNNLLFSKVIGRKNNLIQYDYTFLNKVLIKIDGKNNKVFIGKNSILKNVNINISGNDCEVFIGENVRIRNSTLWLQENYSKINIDEYTTIEGANIASIYANGEISIGRDCMISHDVEIRNADSHSIIDIKSKSRINKGKNIFINDHVWIGAYSKVLKGVNIENDAIVGLGSIVTKSIEKNTMAVGTPAIIKKKNVTWSRKNI